MIGCSALWNVLDTSPGAGSSHVIDTKPELQIFADDVRCTHGATIGQLDAESLFYLQSRGIGKGQARRLLTYAFAQDIIDRIKVQGVKDRLETVLFEKFHEHGG